MSEYYESIQCFDFFEMFRNSITYTLNIDLYKKMIRFQFIMETKT